MPWLVSERWTGSTEWGSWDEGVWLRLWISNSDILVSNECEFVIGSSFPIERVYVIVACAFLGTWKLCFAFVLNGVWSDAWFDGAGLLRWGILNGVPDSNCRKGCLLILVGRFLPTLVLPVRVCTAAVLCLRTWKLVLSALNRIWSTSRFDRRGLLRWVALNVVSDLVPM